MFYTDVSGIFFCIAGEITEDIWLIPTINAVYAIAEGVHRTLKTKCGMNYTGICPKFFSDEDTYDMIMYNMDNMTFMDLTSLLFDFVDREAVRDIEFRRFDNTGTEIKVRVGECITKLFY